MFESSFQLSPVLAAVMSTVCIYCAESDPAAVYSTVRRDDVTYGRIIIKDKKKQSKRRGEVQPLCFVTADPHSSQWGFIVNPALDALGLKLKIVYFKLNLFKFLTCCSTLKFCCCILNGIRAARVMFTTWSKWRDLHISSLTASELYKVADIESPHCWYSSLLWQVFVFGWN